MKAVMVTSEFGGKFKEPQARESFVIILNWTQNSI
jgi:hypothetical protein